MKTGRPATLIVLPSHPLSGDDAAVSALAAAVGLSGWDVRQKCAAGRAAPLLRGPDRALLEAAADAVRDLGHAAVVIDDDAVRRARPALLARAARFSDSGVDFLGEGGRVLATCPAGERLLVSVAGPGTRRANPVPMHPETAARFGREALEEELAAELKDLVSGGREGVLIDVAWSGGAERVRIRADQFALSSLGDAAGPSAAQNLLALLEQLRLRASDALLDLEFEQFQPPRVAAAALALHDGRPVDRPRDQRESDRESYVRFVEAAWRAGLFGVGTATTAKGGDAAGVVGFDGASRVASSAGSAAATAAPRVAGYRSTRAAGASTTTPPNALEMPHWLPPGDDRESPVSQARRAVAGFGPAMLVLPLLAGVAAAVLAASWTGERTWLAVGALPAGLLLMIHGLILFDRKRRVEDVPTSRIRSAAVGPVEIHGHARAGRPLRTPFSLMPCVWYEYRLVIQETGRPRSLSLGGNLLLHAGSGRNDTRTEVRTGSSGDVPFFVEDETGRVEVDPRGAVIEVSTGQTFHQVPFAGAAIPPGAKVVAHERYIPVDYPVYVLGELRVEALEEDAARMSLAAEIRALKADPVRLAAGDRNGDGAVDALEWESLIGELRRSWQADRVTATGRTDRLRIASGSSGGFFYITERSEKAVVGRFSRRAVLALGGGAALVLGGLFQLIRYGYLLTGGS
jgi:hypothetical protein